MAGFIAVPLPISLRAELRCRRAAQDRERGVTSQGSGVEFVSGVKSRSKRGFGRYHLTPNGHPFPGRGGRRPASAAAALHGV